MKTIVVGAGAAGLWAALHAAERGPVVVVAPDPFVGSATAMAQGGIAAAVAEGDDPGEHARDTIAAGAGLCDAEAVRILTTEAPAAIRELLARGMAFDGGGAPTLEGGHTARRVLHAGGDATGWALLRMLLSTVRAGATAGNHFGTSWPVEWVEQRAKRLIFGNGRVWGVRTAAGGEIDGGRVILATGGACGIYGRRTGPDQATGEGMALAWEVGAALADLEFVQFHPTALDVPGLRAGLLTEALRGEGAILVDGGGQRFMTEFDRRGELAPRDVVARAIAALRDRGQRVCLDATAIRDVRERFPTAVETCTQAGLDLARDPIPVAPAAHYFTGGVLTDTWGRTTVPGLYACGEVACSGVHGANRLASNSLLEGLVFGRRVALAPESTGPLVTLEEGLDGPVDGSGPSLEEIRALADRFLGVIRSGTDLAVGVERLDQGPAEGSGEGAALVARLVARAALRREESRGGHFRSDFADPSRGWLARQAVTREGWTTLPVRSAAGVGA